jgi:putative thioredoxin
MRESEVNATHAVDVNTSNFQALVVEASTKMPVVVDFWAPWCAPCRALTPVLEKLAGEYAGRFVLAKVNSDENPELATQFGVRGIPNVKAFVGGEVIAEFSGALPEGKVRQFLEEILPSPADDLQMEAFARYRSDGNVDAALALLDEAQKLDPQSEDVKFNRAALLLEGGRNADARAIIETLTPLAQMDDRVSELKARLDLADGAAGAGSADALEKRVAGNEADLDARLQLAHVYVSREDYRQALEQLLAIVQRDRKFGDDVARKTMLKVFELMGNRGDLVSEFRKRLAGALN